jgi:hypothetical protein
MTCQNTLIPALSMAIIITPPLLLFAWMLRK